MNHIRLFVGLVAVIVISTSCTSCKTNQEKFSGTSYERGLSQSNKEFDLYTFDLSPTDNELKWSDALSEKLNGQREIVVPAGRIDVVTDDLAIEVEKIKKWHEGVGQALHYGLYDNKLPTLAIITYPPSTESIKDTLEVIKSVCKKYKIKLILLMPK